MNLRWIPWKNEAEKKSHLSSSAHAHPHSEGKIEYYTKNPLKGQTELKKGANMIGTYDKWVIFVILPFCF